jgi:hypothetical protein
MELTIFGLKFKIGSPVFEIGNKTATEIILPGVAFSLPKRSIARSTRVRRLFSQGRPTARTGLLDVAFLPIFWETKLFFFERLDRSNKKFG